MNLKIRLRHTAFGDVFTGEAPGESPAQQQEVFPRFFTALNFLKPQTAALNFEPRIQPGLENAFARSASAPAAP